MPEGVFQLKELETLDLYANNISVLPQASLLSTCSSF
jgi:hypothetical protein